VKSAARRNTRGKRLIIFCLLIDGAEVVMRKGALSVVRMMLHKTHRRSGNRAAAVLPDRRRTQGTCRDHEHISRAFYLINEEGENRRNADQGR